jgi:hypothetical protein
MPERHTVDFARCSFNVVSDGERRSIILQFHPQAAGSKREPIALIFKALRRRYGGGLIAHLNRWRTGEGHPFVLPPRTEPHPDCPEVLCYRIRVRPGGGTMDSALATLLEFFREQPGYERTYGAPLDLDEASARVRTRTDVDASTAAFRALAGLMDRRRRRGAGR